jgi:hypothetical protein
MLLLQARQLRPKLAFFLFGHRRLGSRLGAVAEPGPEKACPPDANPGVDAGFSENIVLQQETTRK